MGDRIRWTRNDARHELINGATAEVAEVKGRTVRFRLEDGRVLDTRRDDPQLRHVDRAWASTVHAFQGRTVDTVIAAMEANHPYLTTQKTLYVELSWARDRAELVTDDRNALRERLEAAAGERIAALEAVEPEREKGRRPRPIHGRGREDGVSEPGRRMSEPKKVYQLRKIEIGMEARPWPIWIRVGEDTGLRYTSHRTFAGMIDERSHVRVVRSLNHEIQ